MKNESRCRGPKLAKTLLLILSAIALLGTGQLGTTQATPVPAASATQPAPFLSQLRKTVIFIDVLCQDGANQIHVQGTGFIVAMPDDRLGKDRGFGYLVTNRHMAEPSLGLHRPVSVLNTALRVNLRTPSADGQRAETINLGPMVPWHFSPDPSVDLAVFPMMLDNAVFDYLTIPISIFATRDIVTSRGVGEGDSIALAGYFAQFPGMKKIQPIVREGMLAMMPDEEMQTTLGALGDLYLADVHTFHGNSGSPVFVNLAGMRGGNMIVGADYKLLGVVSGYFPESADLTIQVAATLIGTVEGNSNVTAIVPADEIKAIIDSPELGHLRDQAVASSAASSH
jgi:hypothetical protein